MEKLLLFAPQWQDSGLTNEIYKGSCALKNYCEKMGSCKFKEVTIDDSSIPMLKNNIFGHDLIKDQLHRIRSLLNQEKPEKVYSLGGGCGIEVPIVFFLNERYDKNISVFWFDAHGDLNTPENSPSKHFHGMPLRFITDKVENSLYQQTGFVSPGKITLLGTRDLDEPEKEFIDKKNMNVLKIDSSSFSEKVGMYIKNMDGSAYVHIDLDVIDPKYYRNVKCPTENGLSIEELEKTIEIINEKLDIVGYSIVENTEQNEAKIQKLKKIINIGFSF